VLSRPATPIKGRAEVGWNGATAPGIQGGEHPKSEITKITFYSNTVTRYLFAL